MGIERCIGHTKKEEGNAFLFFRPEAASGVRHGGAWTTARYRSLCAHLVSLGFSEDKV